MMNIKKIGLCQGRHEIPEVTEYFFGQTLDPTDINGMYNEAFEKIETQMQDVDVIHLYVTGLTVALVAVINATRTVDMPLILYHFDRETGEYYPQQVY